MKLYVNYHSLSSIIHFLCKGIINSYSKKMRILVILFFIFLNLTHVLFFYFPGAVKDEIDLIYIFIEKKSWEKYMNISINNVSMKKENRVSTV